jgi:hypothetical protein
VTAVWDIFAGILIVAAGSLGLFWCGLAIARHGSAVATGLALAAVVFILWFALAVHGTLLMARALPFSNVIVLGNWIPLAAAFLSGIVGGQEVIPLWRRLTFTAMMLFAAWYTNYFSLSGQPPESRDLWSSKRVCLQTTASSCSACAAVMLLRECGIRSDEEEMIKLCLTGYRGTPPLGLYRGLMAKTAGTDWTVEVVRCNLADLPREVSTPTILLVTLDSRQETLRAKARQWFGAPAITDHAVLLYRFAEDGKAVIGDPAGGVEPCAGRYHWNAIQLKDRWGGEGLRLVPRRPQSVADTLVGQRADVLATALPLPSK